MILLTVDKVIKLHEKMIIATGGLYGIRDKGLLEPSTYGAVASFDGQEVYKTLVMKKQLD